MTSPESPADRAQRIIGEVLGLHEACRQMPLLEVFDTVMQGLRGTELDFDCLLGEGPGAAFAGLLIQALQPYTPQEQRILDSGQPDEILAFCEFDEHRCTHAAALFLLRYELNGYQGQQAWAEAFAARTVALKPAAEFDDALAIGLTLWAQGSWNMTAEAAADWFSRH